MMEHLVKIARLAGLAALLAGAAGCSEEACFNWSEAEGACPSQAEAMEFFVPPGCFGPIESVDSEGELIVDDEDPIPGDLCCYSVTKSGNDFGGCSGGF